MMGDRPAAPRPSYWLVLIFAALTVGIAGGARLAYVRQRNEVRDSRALLVQGATRMQAEYIRSGITDRIHEAATMGRACRALLQNGQHGGNAASLRQARAWARVVGASAGYHSVHIVDRSGDIVVHEERTPCLLASEVRAAAMTAVRTNAPVCSGIRETDTGLHLAVAAPVPAADATGPPVGAVALDVDPHATLLGPLGTWPGPSASWETILVQAPDRRIAVIRAPGPPPRRPTMRAAPEQDAIIRQALSGRIVHMIGYAAPGRLVLAHIEPIPQAQWVLIGRESIEETDRLLRVFAVPWIIAVLMLVTFAFAALYGLWQSQAARQIRMLAAAEEEQREAERALSESRALLRVILDMAPQRIFWKDRGSRYLGCNLPFARDAGFDNPDQLQGADDFGMSWKANAEQYRRDDQEVMTSGVPKIGYEEPQVRLDGVRRWLRTSKVPLRNEQGEVYGVMGTYEDITDQIEAIRSLEEARAELEHKHRELERLLFVTSHDLRRPLVTIQGFAAELQRSVNELLEQLEGIVGPADRSRRIDESVTGEIPRFAGYVSEGVRFLDRMMQGLLDISRLDRADFDMRTVDMNRLVGGLIGTMGPEADQAGAVVAAGSLPPCWGDCTRLEQAFGNLLSNAIRYLEPGRPGIIRISGEIQGEHAVYCVEDNGIGIAEEHLERVFDMFFRAAPGHVDGDGLGLAGVQAIVRKHGGRCWAESEIGTGTRMYVSLPTTAAAGSGARKEAP